MPGRKIQDQMASLVNSTPSSEQGPGRRLPTYSDTKISKTGSFPSEIHLVVKKMNMFVNEMFETVIQYDTIRTHMREI